jgi:uncharacterized protein YndB with AHSA1/START domain
MAGKLKAEMSINFNAPLKKVWQALTDPKIIKQYLFGTETESDWKKGSPITYRGDMNGEHFEDKGEIVDIIPEKRLHTTHHSSVRSNDDHFNNVIYELQEEKNGHTVLTLSEDNIETEDELLNTEENWSRALDNMKRIVER